MTRKYALSRRKALAGLATVGLAGAGAGLGTSALFSDEETIENNTFTAGTLDMSVTAEIVAANSYYTEEGPGPDVIGDMGTADGEVVTGLQADDVKPGDWVIICFDIVVEDNPGYVKISADDFSQAENGQPDPEEEVDDSEEEGELHTEMLAEVYGDFDGEVSSENPRDYLSDPDPTADEGTTVNEAFSTYETGVTLRNSDDEPATVGGDGVSWYLLLYVPSNVGNEIQTDSLSFDLLFTTEQTRNNPTPFDGAESADATTESTDTPLDT